MEALHGISPFDSFWRCKKSCVRQCLRVLSTKKTCNAPQSRVLHFSTIVPFGMIANGLNEKGSTIERPTIDLLLISAHYFEKQP